MKKLTLKLSLVFFSMIVLLSCEKKSVQTNNNGVQSIDNVLSSPQYDGMAQYYKEFLNSNRLGYYALHASSGLNTTNGIADFSAGGFFYPDANRKAYLKVGDKILINGTLVNEYSATTGAYSMVTDIEKTLPQFFGQQISISVVSDAKNNKIAAEKTIDIYAPKDFVLNSTAPVLQGNLSRTKPFTITWNADIKNTNGVAIIVDWSGELQGPRPDGSMGPNIGSTRVRNVDFIEDKGTYTFDGSKMLKDIPKEARVEIALYRGSYKIETISGITSRFDAYSEWHSTIRTVIN